MRHSAAPAATCLALLYCASAGGLTAALSAEDAWALSPGDEVPLVLLLEGGDSLAVTARVRPLRAG